MNIEIRIGLYLIRPTMNGEFSKILPEIEIEIKSKKFDIITIFLLIKGTIYSLN